MSKKRHIKKKTLPLSKVMGQKGINLIEKIFLDLGLSRRLTERVIPNTYGHVTQ